jgi:predicted transcriptional regulator
MARPTAAGLTDHELVIMRLLWKESPLAVSELLDRFPREPKPAYTSLLTAIQAMEKKGLVGHEKEGRAFRYRPLLQKAKYKRSALRRLLGSVFDDDAFDLAVNLLKEEKLDDAKIKKLKQLLETL